MQSSVKERLTGALILIVALVIVVPELFSGRPEQRPTTDAPDAQSADAGAPLRSYTMELGAAPAGQSTPEPATVTEAPIEAAPAPTPAPTPAPSSTATPAPKAVESPSPVLPEPTLPATKPPLAKTPVAKTPAAKPPVVAPASSAPVSKPPAATAAAAHGWWVQLGSFSARANADRLAATLGSAGYSVRVSPTVKNGKELYRVLAGPAEDRAAALALQARLAAAGHKGSSLVAP